MAEEGLSESVLYSRMVARLRLRHLRLLVALDECLALGAAAREVGMSQPAATQMLKELESLLEVQLYVRHSRGLRPTPAAQVLSRHARSALGNLQQAAVAMAGGSEGQDSVLHVGAIPAAIAALLSPRIALLQRKLPRLRMSVLEGSPEYVTAQLNAGLLQVALVRAPAGGAVGPFRFLPLHEDRIAIVASVRHPMARRRGVRLAELGEFPWSLPWPTYRTGIAFETAARAAGLVPRRTSIQSISADLLGRLVDDGQTLAAVPRAIVTPLLERGELVELPTREKIALPPLGALYPVSVTPSAVDALVAALGEPLGARSTR